MTLHVPWHGQLCMSLKESIKRIKYTKKIIHKKKFNFLHFLANWFHHSSLKQCKKEIKFSKHGAKKVIFKACRSGKLKLANTSPNVISTSPKNILMSRIDSQFFCNLNSSKNFTCPSGKLRTKLTSLIEKSTSHKLLDTTSLHAEEGGNFVARRGQGVGDSQKTS